MRKVFIVVSALVIIATIIGCGFLVYHSLTYESETDDDIFGNHFNFFWVPIAVFILLFEFTISHGILYFTSFEWKTKLKDILNGISDRWIRKYKNLIHSWHCKGRKKGINRMPTPDKEVFM